MEKYRILLDLTYEIEGLLHMAMERRDGPERVDELLIEKSKALLNGLVTNAQNYISQSIAPEALELGVEDTIEVTESQIDPERGEEIDDEEGFEAPEKNFDTTEENSEEKDDLSEEESEDLGFYNLEDDEEAEEPVRVVHNRPLPKFSLNDKFLFIREFFDGNPSEFNAAVAKLTDFYTAEEAEAYFMERYSITPDSDAGTAFLSLIQSYYTK